MVLNKNVNLLSKNNLGQNTNISQVFSYERARQVVVYYHGRPCVI